MNSSEGVVRSERLQLLRFIIVGSGSAALLAASTYALLKLGLAPFSAGLLSYSVCFVLAYLLQRNWTFGGRSSHYRTLPRYFIVQLLCAATSALLTHFLTRRAGFSSANAAAIMTLCMAAVSYLASSLWVFEK